MPQSRPTARQITRAVDVVSDATVTRVGPLRAKQLAHLNPVLTSQRGEESGRSEAESSEREPRRPARSDGPLVHSDLCFQNLDKVAATRRLRYRRRSRSSELLIADARRSEGLEPYPNSSISAENSDWVRPLRPARCRWRVAENIGVHGTVGETAHYSGTERCGSVWACPVCSAVIRYQRSEEIESAVANWQGQGKWLAFLTLTVRHGKKDDLASLLDGLLNAWRKTIAGRAWVDQKVAVKLEGFIRATEITWGEANGWHPHLHILLFFSEPVSPRMLAAFKTWLADRWKSRVLKEGLRQPTKVRGVDLRAVDKGGKMVAQYLAKIQEGYADTDRSANVHLELARGDMKTRKESVAVRKKAGRELRLMPFEMLDPEEVCALPKRRAEALWAEYVRATSGRRAFHWSKDLRSLCGLVKTEQTDEEIINDSEQGDLQFLIPGKVWDQIRSMPDQMAGILEAVERQSISAARALAAGDLVVMVEGEFWIEVETGRCFTPAEAAAHFGGELVIAPPKVVVPLPLEVVENSEARLLQQEDDRHVSLRENGNALKQKRWLAAERQWYTEMGEEPPRRLPWQEVVQLFPL